MSSPPLSSPRRSFALSITDDEDELQLTSLRLVSNRHAHFWSLEERILLLALVRFLDVSWEDIAKILNAFFAIKTEEGCFASASKFRSKMASSQWAELMAGLNGRRTETGEDAWHTIWEEKNFSRALLANGIIIERVKQIAHKLGIRFNLRSHDCQEQKSKVARRSGASRNRKANAVLSVAIGVPPRPCTASSVAARTTRLDETSTITSRSLASNNDVYTRGLVRDTSGGWTQPGQLMCVRIPPSPLSASSSQTLSYSLDLSPPPAWNLTSSALQPSRQAQLRPSTETLLFRAYNSHSQGINLPTLFRAAKFVGMVNGRLIAVPPAPEVPDLIETSNHLTPNPIAGPFISSTPSMIWAIHKMLKSTDGSLAILNKEILQTDTHVYNAHDLLATLRANAMYTNSINYSGKFEKLIWGQIREGAIYTTLDRQHLEVLAQRSTWVGQLLRLEVLENCTTVSAARAEFKRNQIVLDDRMGAAMGKLFLCLNFTHKSAERVITELVHCIVQGWVLQVDLDDSTTVEYAYRAFRAILTDVGSVSDYATYEPTLRVAFEEGVRRAAQDLLKDREHRQNSKSRRRRQAVIERYSKL